MDAAFIYGKPVTGRSNIGRKAECKAVANLLAQGENIVIYEPPKAGKTSLVQQSLMNMKSSGTVFTTVSLSFLDTRSIKDLLVRLGSEIIKAVSSSQADFGVLVSELLPGTHFVFDPRLFETGGEVISPNWEIDDDDIRAVFSLPYRAARKKGQRMFVIIDEFQNTMLTEDGYRVCKKMEEVFAGLSPEEKASAAYICMGSQVNAMYEIFGTKRFFFRQAERIKLGEIDTNEIIEHVIHGFLLTGKVIDRELLMGVCKLFRCNIWYINHFSAICDSLTKGYIMEPVLAEALAMLISIHEPRFVATMNDLTTFQVRMLRAILDGHSKFTSTEVIESYGLNSSANVRRLRDALCKKEVVFFDESGKAQVLDPLFEYWARRFYFKMKI